MKDKFVINSDGVYEWHQASKTNPEDIIIYQESPQGTFFKKDTPQKVKDILDRFRGTTTRLFIDTGDSTTGQSWGECYDVQGRIGRSMGLVKVPLLLANSRSTGGGAILDACIVRIKFTGKHGKELYRYPTYQPPKVEFPQQAKLYADVLAEQVNA
jgi:hypothetical protein